ncbi:hypothetical protein HDU79_009278 [Rhizoclosmatium sp. JEL0117]|nr:hypothetical protein HDU79_009278 [Rhizoclosmatium sp. JEL0117]
MRKVDGITIILTLSGGLFGDVETGDPISTCVMDFYEILRVDRNAPPKAIYESYIELSSKIPTEKRSLTTAYLVLSRDRSKYDEQGENYKVPDEFVNIDVNEIVKHPIIPGTYTVIAATYGATAGAVVGGPIGAAVVGGTVGTAVAIVELFSFVTGR